MSWATVPGISTAGAAARPTVREGLIGMRVFRIDAEGDFTEYNRTHFAAEHEERILEKWLEDNPQGIVEDGELLIIGRQVRTDVDSYIDLLGLDRSGNVAVVELKRGSTPRDTIAQALEYASFVSRLDSGQIEEILQSYLDDDTVSLSAYHRRFF